jgi:hypothetical protein
MQTRALLAALAVCAALSAEAPAQETAGRSRALESYARTFGTTAEEAERRQHLRREIVGVRHAMERGEPDSFAGLTIEHSPAYRVVVKFTSNPEATLRRYTDNPLFVAQAASVPMRDLLAAQTPVHERLKSHGIRSASAPDFERNDLQVAVQDLPLAERLRASGALKLPPFVRLVQGHWPADYVDPPGY